MAAYLERLAEYYNKKGNKPRADLYSALAAEERAKRTPETFPDGQRAQAGPSPKVEAVRPQEALSKSQEIPTAESLTAQWRERWVQWGRRISRGYNVPDLTATPEQVAEIYKGGRKIIYLPSELTGKRGLENLGIIFPVMRSWATSDGTTVVSDFTEGGYLAVESSLDAPNLRTDEKQLRNLFESQGRKGMNLPTYIVASQDSKLQAGHYFDEKTWSRLLSSRCVGVLRASFDPGGGLNVGSLLGPRGQGPGLGGRSLEEIRP